MKNISTRCVNVKKAPSPKGKILLFFIAAITILLTSACGRDRERNINNAYAYENENANGNVYATSNESYIAYHYQQAPHTEGHETPALTLEEVLAMALHRREGIIKPGYERLAELTAGRPRQTVNLAAMLEPVERAEIISAADAIYDIELFFNLLREVYGELVSFLPGQQHDSLRKKR